MPELPEVETVRRGLAPTMVGHRLAEVVVHRADLRTPVPDDFVQRVAGQRVEAIDRRAKYLLFRLGNDAVIIAHLGMSGRMVIGGDAAPATHEHISFRLDNGDRVGFHDPRRFGLMTLADADSVAEHPLLRHLGLEPLSEALDGAALAAAFAGRNAPVKSLLLDQRLIAGIGNIYACESLHYAGISPRRKGASVTGVRATRLAAAIGAVLAAAIDAGGSSLRDYVQSSGELGYFQHRFSVYGRDGDACRRCGDGHTVRRIVQAGRSTFFCPQCQR